MNPIQVMNLVIVPICYSLFITVIGISLNKKYPNLKTPLLNRHNHYNETVKFCEQLENEGKVLILRPEYNLDSFEKDINKLKSSYDHGYNLAINHLSEIKKLFD